MRSQRQMLIKAGREAGIMVDVEGESNFYNNLTMILDGNTNLQHNFPVATYYDDVVQLMNAREVIAYADTRDRIRRADGRELHLPAPARLG